MYCANRFFNLFAEFEPHCFFENHLNDLCGGIIFPAYVDLTLILFNSPYSVSGLAFPLIIGVLCAISWEVIAPLILPYSTGDWIDAVLYIFGCLLYAILRKLLLHNN